MNIEGLANAGEVYHNALCEGMQLPENINIAEWAEAKRIIPSKGAAEPGPWRNSRTPYLVKIMEDLSPGSEYHEIGLMKGTQLGGTEVGNNWLGHTIEIDPSDFLMTFPTDKLGIRHAKQKINPTIRETPSLKQRINPNDKKSSEDTLMMKEYKGGMFSIVGGRSAVGLRSFTAGKIMIDEYDAYVADLDGEGDPVDLLENRGDTYFDLKIYKLSTPLTKGSSRIEAFYEKSNQQKYYVPCPHCKKKQVLKWGSAGKFGIQFTKDEKYNVTSEVTYMCEHCHKHIEEYHKTEMLEKGEWVAKYPERSTSGFHLPTLYSPLGWVSWGKLAREFLEAKKLLTRGDDRKMKRFVNTRLAETWEEKSESLDLNSLYNRRQEYQADVPNEAGILICSIDMQGNRLELEVKGWGLNDESFGVGVYLFIGDPVKMDVWNELYKFLSEKEFKTPSGRQMKIKASGIDTGGIPGATTRAYDFVRKYGKKLNIFALKGSNQYNKPIISTRPSFSNKGKIPLYLIGTDTAKHLVFSRLNLDSIGAGYMHFSMRYDNEYFNQLTAEKAITKYVNGYAVKKWIKDAGRANEALDLNVYNIAIYELLKNAPNINMERYIQNTIDKKQNKTTNKKRKVRSKGVR